MEEEAVATAPEAAEAAAVVAVAVDTGPALLLIIWAEMVEMVEMVVSLERLLSSLSF